MRKRGKGKRVVDAVKLRFVGEDEVSLGVGRGGRARSRAALGKPRLLSLERLQVRVGQNVQRDALARAQGRVEHLHKDGELLEAARALRDVLHICTRAQCMRTAARDGTGSWRHAYIAF